MKASDISDRAVLEFLAKHQGRWSTWGERSLQSRSFIATVHDVMPPNTPAKVELAKLRQLRKRGLIGGCPCGCRGDWEITDKGLELIGQTRIKPYTGY